MKKAFLLPAAIMLTISLQAQKKTPAKTTTSVKKPVASTAVVSLKNEKDSLSYAFGLSLGQYMKSMGIKNLNYAMLTKAIDQTLLNQPTLLDQAGANELMASVGEKKRQQITDTEKEKGKSFLAKNKTREGVVETASGLQYEILTKGTGALPKATDTVVAHYKGMLLDGKEFDNSYQRGEPLSIPVSGVIPGWTEALQLMPVGSKWKLFIPSSIAYGDYGAGQDIPGGSTLIFEVELLSIGNNK